MKKFLSLLGVLTVLAGVVNANVDKPRSPVGMAVVKSASGFKLFYKGEKRGDVSVTIYNVDGRIVHKEKLHRVESFVRPYNLSSLKDGEYTVELVGEDGTQMKKVNYSSVKNARPMKLIRIAGEENKYLLSVPNSSKEELTIKIYDEANTLIFNITEKIESDFAKVFRLDKVGRNFTFEVTDKSGTTRTLSHL